MSSKTPKTGLAAGMRDWMSKQRKPFTAGMVADALDTLPGAARGRVRNALGDFVARAEVFPAKRIRGQIFYAYNRAWHRVHKGLLNRRIFKAMYVSGQFTVADIQRLAEAPDRSWVDKVSRTLKKDGLIRSVGRRPCAHGIGAEIIYHIPDRDRFRLEVMK
jgi:hypothetical protein